MLQTKTGWERKIGGQGCRGTERHETRAIDGGRPDTRVENLQGAKTRCCCARERRASPGMCLSDDDWPQPKLARGPPIFWL
eukprot:6062702-Prymnesium_polylepis.1